ncbi:MAG: heme o synthase [Rhizobiaceae bacterium]
MAFTHDDRLVESVSVSMPGDFIALLKPRVMSLVVFTALVGMVLAPSDTGIVTALIAVLCIAVGAGASGALNMWYDADIDAVMSRTSQRPIPGGRLRADEALTFGLVLSVFSVMALGVLVNWLAASLLAFTIFFYAVIYTAWLKRSTPQNIVIGGAAGALPPIVGWAAMTNSLSFEPLVLFAIIFLWTPPHFWALALFKSQDYARAGIPMMPNVRGNRSTQRQIFAYSWAVLACGLLPWITGFASHAYGLVAAVLGLEFVRNAWCVLRMDSSDKVMKPAKRLFAYSIIYLFVIFSALLAEGTWQHIQGSL